MSRNFSLFYYIPNRKAFKAFQLGGNSAKFNFYLNSHCYRFDSFFDRIFL